jgi:hypothetical protein
MLNTIEELKHLKTDYELALYLQSILIARATGLEPPEHHYQELRAYFLENSATKDLLPSWVKSSRDVDQFWIFIRTEFSTYVERRNFIWNEFSPLLDYLEHLPKVPSEQSITQRLKRFDTVSVHFAWQKALERKDHDPEGAITLSRTILESVCKHILDDIGIEYDKDKIELHQLYKMTAKELNLSPDQHSEQIFKQILSGCSAIVNGLGSVRNRFGDAHGQGKQPVKPAPRHAELAVNLAGTMAMFLVETYSIKKETKPED